MTLRKLATAATLALVLPLSACGGASDEETAASALATSLRGGNDSIKLSQKEADCMGKALVDKVGLEDLQKYGIIKDDLSANKTVTDVKMSRTDATGASDALIDCTDAKAKMVEAMGSTNLNAKVKTCLESKLTEKIVHDVFVEIFSGDAAKAQQKMLTPMQSCVAS